MLMFLFVFLAMTILGSTLFEHLYLFLNFLQDHRVALHLLSLLNFPLLDKNKWVFFHSQKCLIFISCERLDELLVSFLEDIGHVALFTLSEITLHGSLLLRSHSRCSQLFLSHFFAK